MRGMYWSDFWKFVKQHAYPYARLGLYGPNREYPNKIDIYDRSIPTRKNYHLLLGDHEYDHWRDSYVCTAAFHNGEIPFKSWYKLNDDGHSLDHKGTARGAVDVVDSLLAEGSLRRSEELEQWMSNARNGRL